MDSLTALSSARKHVVTHYASYYTLDWLTQAHMMTLCCSLSKTRSGLWNCLAYAGLSLMSLISARIHWRLASFLETVPTVSMTQNKIILFFFFFLFFPSHPGFSFPAEIPPPIFCNLFSFSFPPFLISHQLTSALFMLVSLRLAPFYTVASEECGHRRLER